MAWLFGNVGNTTTYTMTNKSRDYWILHSCIADLFLKYGGKDSDVPKLAQCTLIPGIKSGFNVQDENNFLYTKDKAMADGSSTWCCKKRHKFRCKAVIRVADGLIIWQRREHNHLYTDK